MDVLDDGKVFITRFFGSGSKNPNDFFRNLLYPHPHEQTRSETKGFYFHATFSAFQKREYLYVLKKQLEGGLHQSCSRLAVFSAVFTVNFNILN